MAELAYQCLAMRQGGPLEVHQAEPHIPGDDEILVNIKAVALNPIEWKQIDFGINIPKWPCVLGGDGSGTVVAVGKSVTGFNTGDSVLASFSSGQDRSAAFQSRAVVNATKVAKKPTSMSFEEAATLPLSYVTATGAIYQGLNIPLPYLEGGKEEGFKPSSILVCGGSSSVGAMAVQLLRLALPKAQIFTTASKQHHHTAKNLGADQVFDHSSPSLVEEVKKASSSGEGVEAILDAVNGVAVNPSLFEVLTGPKAFAEVVTGRNVEKAPDGVKHSPVFGATVYGQPGGSNLFAALERLLADGKLKLPTAVKVVGHGLESISRGLDELRAGVSGTKLVVSL